MTGMTQKRALKALFSLWSLSTTKPNAQKQIKQQNHYFSTFVP